MIGRHAHYETGSFGLLFVCTGNICRSPFAEILTRHLLRGRLGGRAAAAFEVSSAGVRALVGSPMHDDTRNELSPWGLDGPAGEFVARQLRSAQVERADLVLGAGPRHRSAVLERAPVGLGRVFALREFARLATSVDPAALPAHPVARAHAMVEQAGLRRGLLPPGDPDDDVVPDPMGQDQDAHHRAAALIRAAVEAIVDVIAPPKRAPR